MIFYNPNNGDVQTTPIKYQVRSCFLITQLGGQIPKEAIAIRKIIDKICKKQNYKLIDALHKTTGKNILEKILLQIFSMPVSVAIYHEENPDSTMSNIYYELAYAQATGKETVLVKSKKAKLPSDLSGIEYIEYNNNFENNFTNFFKQCFDIAKHYETTADQLDQNPVLALDYLCRAYLITGNENLRDKAKKLLTSADLDKRAKNSVEKMRIPF